MSAAAATAAASGGKSTGRPFPPESGRITINGQHWTNQGKPWFWRGATMFLLLERQMNGEDISPQIDWMVGKGVNVARVFVAGVPWAGHDWLYDRPTWLMQLGDMSDRLAAAGIRLEATVCTDRGDEVRRWTPVLQDVYDTLAIHQSDLSFVEWINEPWVQGDGLTFARDIKSHGILSAYGLQPPFGDTGVVRMLDYGTVHLPRDLDHYPRNSKDLKELQISNGRPWVSDEPLGIADYDKEGAGARTTNRMAVAGHFGIASLFGGGATIHSQCGLEGRAPSSAEPITEALAQTISDIWQFIPTDAPTGDYSAPHVWNWPLTWTPGDTDSDVHHAYASIMGNVAYAVVPMPRAGYEPQGVNGWRVDAQLLPGIVRLVR